MGRGEAIWENCHSVRRGFSVSSNCLIKTETLHTQTEQKNVTVTVLVVKNRPANAGDMRHRFSPWVGKVSWKRAWQPTPVFLPRAFHGPRNQVGYIACRVA